VQYYFYVVFNGLKTNNFHTGTSHMPMMTVALMPALYICKTESFLLNLLTYCVQITELLSPLSRRLLHQW